MSVLPFLSINDDRKMNRSNACIVLGVFLAFSLLSNRGFQASFIHTIIQQETVHQVATVKNVKEEVMMVNEQQTTMMIVKNRVHPTYVELIPEFCSQCGAAHVPNFTTCLLSVTLEIRKEAKNNISLSEEVFREAMASVANHPGYKGYCKPCHPKNCKLTVKTTHPLGLEEAAPTVLQAVTYATLDSIPTDRRFPLDLGSYLKRRSFRDLAPLAVYNPSIIPIPENTLNSFSEFSSPGTSSASASSSYPLYLATFRVTMVNACMSVVPFDWRKCPSDYLGVALLDNHLQIVRQVVIDANYHFFGNRTFLEDYRLFTMNGTTYLTSGIYLLPIEVLADEETETKGTVLSNMFGEGLRVSVLGGFRTLPIKGKNFQYFQSTSGQHMVEYWPLSPREVVPIHGIGPNTSKLVVGDKIVSDAKPKPSFTSDEVLLTGYFRHSRDRGSACCLKLEQEYYRQYLKTANSTGIKRTNAWRKLVKEQPYLLIGISHSKAIKKLPVIDVYTYLSRLYAFIPVEPFETVAISSLFCFGHVDTDTPQPYMNLTHRIDMTVNDKVYKCPSVHFVSSMTEKAEDPSRVVVAYGVEDCVARFVEVHKQDLAAHLFTTLDTLLSVT